MIVKEDEALNQWLDEQLKAGLIKESKSRYIASLLRLKLLVLDRRRTLYRVYTRELDGELCTA